MSSLDIIKGIVEPALAKIDLELNSDQYNQILQYYNKLVEWNKVMNLTALTDEHDFSVKHIVDSLLSYDHFDFNSVDSFIDIGTGAGLPGIPLKIAFPHLKITLLDSLNKRIKFLDEVVQTLHLDNVTTLHGRAEDYGKDEDHREQYDVCVSRAVSQLPILSEYCIPFVQNGGKFIAYKSSDTDDEIQNSSKAIELLGGGNIKIMESQLNDQVSRRFVVIDKVNDTPARYPRKAGMPQKRPLK